MNHDTTIVLIGLVIGYLCGFIVEFVRNRW